MAAHLQVALGGSTMTAWAASATHKRKSGGYWEEEVVQLMMGRPLHHLDVMRPSSHSSTSSAAPPSITQNATCSTTLDLLGSSTSAGCPPPPPPPPEDPESASSCCFDLDAHSPLPSGWEKCLDLQTGSIYYLNRSTGLSTACDPRKAATSSVNWPTSPSSSSDLTFEGNVPVASSSKPIHTSSIEGPSYESTNLDLTLSLKPSSPCLRPSSLSLNNDLKSDFNRKLRSVISSQRPVSNQTVASSISSLPLNSPRTSFALPTCTSSSTTSSTSQSSPSTLFFQELNGFKDMGSFGTSIASSKESKHQSVNGVSRHTSNNLSMNVREKPLMQNPSPVSKKVSVSAKARPISSDTHTHDSSAMITVGCANCLMFVMLPQSCSPKCPRCGAGIDSDLPQPLSIKKPKLVGFSLMN